MNVSMEATSRLLSLKKPLKYGYIHHSHVLIMLSKISWELCCELGLAFHLTQPSTQVPSLTSKSVATQASMSYLGLKTWDSCEMAKQTSMISTIVIAHIAHIDLKRIGT